VESHDREVRFAAEPLGEQPRVPVRALTCEAGAVPHHDDHPDAPDLRAALDARYAALASAPGSPS